MLYWKSIHTNFFFFILFFIIFTHKLASNMLRAKVELNSFVSWLSEKKFD